MSISKLKLAYAQIKSKNLESFYKLAYAQTRLNLWGN